MKRYRLKSLSPSLQALHGVAVLLAVVLVNIALGNVDPAVCAKGMSPGQTADVAVILRAVNNTLSECST